MADFSAFETTQQGTWQLGGVIDYYSKVVLACWFEVTATQTAADLCAALDAAEARAQEKFAPLVLEGPAPVVGCRERGSGGGHRRVSAQEVQGFGGGVDHADHGRVTAVACELAQQWDGGQRLGEEPAA